MASGWGTSKFVSLHDVRFWVHILQIKVTGREITYSLQDGIVVETGTHPELVDLGGHYSEMWNRQKDTGAIARSISTASMSSATTSRAADGEGSQAGDHPRRVSRGIVGSLFGATQAMLGYGGGQGSSEAQAHGSHDGHG